MTNVWNSQRKAQREGINAVLKLINLTFCHLPEVSNAASALYWVSPSCPLNPESCKQPLQLYLSDGIFPPTRESVAILHLDKQHCCEIWALCLFFSFAREKKKFSGTVFHTLPHSLQTNLKILFRLDFFLLLLICLNHMIVKLFFIPGFWNCFSTSDTLVELWL